jgi:hypothetical protein
MAKGNWRARLPRVLQAMSVTSGAQKAGMMAREFMPGDSAAKLAARAASTARAIGNAATGAYVRGADRAAMRGARKTGGQAREGAKAAVAGAEREARDFGNKMFGVDKARPWSDSRRLSNVQGGVDETRAAGAGIVRGATRAGVRIGAERGAAGYHFRNGAVAGGAAGAAAGFAAGRSGRDEEVRKGVGAGELGEEPMELMKAWGVLARLGGRVASRMGVGRGAGMTAMRGAYRGAANGVRRQAPDSARVAADDAYRAARNPVLPVGPGTGRPVRSPMMRMTDERGQRLERVPGAGNGVDARAAGDRARANYMAGVPGQARTQGRIAARSAAQGFNAGVRRKGGMLAAGAGAAAAGGGAAAFAAPRRREEPGMRKAAALADMPLAKRARLAQAIEDGDAAAIAALLG